MDNITFYPSSTYSSSIRLSKISARRTTSGPPISSRAHRSAYQQYKYVCQMTFDKKNYVPGWFVSGFHPFIRSAQAAPSSPWTSFRTTSSTDDGGKGMVIYVQFSCARPLHPHGPYRKWHVGHADFSIAMTAAAI